MKVTNRIYGLYVSAALAVCSSIVAFPVWAGETMIVNTITVSSVGSFASSSSAHIKTIVNGSVLEDAVYDTPGSFTTMTAEHGATATTSITIHTSSTSVTRLDWLTLFTRLIHYYEQFNIFMED